MSIRQFIRNPQDFDDDAVRLMSDAFTAACAEAGVQSEEIFQEMIALRIIEAAKKGERDPMRLRRAGLATLDLK